MIEIIINNLANSLLRRKATDKGCKAVLIRIPNDLYAKTMQKQARMISEAAEKGNTSNISINSVVLEALKDFMTY
jgi:hypothetical protein